MEALLTAAGVILAVVWGCSALWVHDIASEASKAEGRPLDAYDYLTISLGPFTALPMLWSDREGE